MGREVTSLTGYRAHVDALIQARQWETLLKDDQLAQMLSESGSVLRPSVTAESPEVCHWQEPNTDPSKSGPAFAPSFKLKVPGPGYSEKRMPAWTDRIIFWSLHEILRITTLCTQWWRWIASGLTTWPSTRSSRMCFAITTDTKFLGVCRP